MAKESANIDTQQDQYKKSKEAWQKSLLERKAQYEERINSDKKKLEFYKKALG